MSMRKLIESLGRYTFESISFLGKLFMFAGEVLVNFFRKPFYPMEVVSHMENVGYKSLPIVVMICFFAGMILSLNIGKSMDNIVKGTSQYIGAGIMLAMLKELGPVLTAIALISRVGASTTSQISSMKATEQIDALEILSIPPINFLVVPRVLGITIMMPFLNAIGTLSGFIGGYIMAISQLEVSTSNYIDKSLIVLKSGDIFEALIKSSILGFVVGIVSSFYGLNSKGGAEGVGIYTTRSVVMSLISVVVVDFLITSLFITIRRII